MTMGAGAWTLLARLPLLLLLLRLLQGDRVEVRPALLELQGWHQA